MQIIRVHDPTRHPPSWTDIIQPGQFAAFPADAASGVACDVAGRCSSDPLAAVCVLFDALEDADAWCRQTVAATPSIKFDVFDADGRVNPALLTIVHPSREASLETAPAALRRRRVAGWASIALGAGCIVFAYVERHGAGTLDIDVIFPGVVGINVLLLGARLLWMNLIVRETERAREARVAGRTRPSRRPTRR